MSTSKSIGRSTIQEVAQICQRAVAPHIADIWKKENWNRYYERHEDQWNRVIEITETLDVPINEYVEGVFYRTWGERVYPIWWHGRNFAKDWAVAKFYDYKVLKERGELSDINMEKRFIERTAELVNSEGNYFEQGVLIPRVCKDVFEHKISVAYMSVHPEFKKLYSKIPDDVKDEYFDTERLYNTEHSVRITPELYRYIRRINDGN